MGWKIYQFACVAVAAEFVYNPAGGNNPLVIAIVSIAFAVLMTKLVYWCLWPFEWAKRVTELGRLIREAEEAARPAPRRPRLPRPYSPWA